MNQEMCGREPLQAPAKRRDAANKRMVMLAQNPECVMSYFQDRRVQYAG
ncbi:MAG: hypothetical protein HEQ39_00875 [Rhizobacter sp.]